MNFTASDFTYANRPLAKARDQKNREIDNKIEELSQRFTSEIDKLESKGYDVSKFKESEHYTLPQSALSRSGLALDKMKDETRLTATTFTPLGLLDAGAKAYNYLTGKDSLKSTKDKLKSNIADYETKQQNYEDKNGINVAGYATEAIPYVIGGFSVGGAKGATFGARALDTVGKNAIVDATVSSTLNAGKDDALERIATDVAFGVPFTFLGQGVSELANNGGRAFSYFDNTRSSMPIDPKPTVQATGENGLSAEEIASRLLNKNTPDNPAEAIKSKSTQELVNEFFNPVKKAQGNGELKTPADQYDPFVFNPKQKENDIFGFKRQAQEDELKAKQLEELRAKHNEEVLSLMGHKRENPNDILLDPIKKRNALPDVLPTDPIERKEVLAYAIKNNAIDEYFAKLPKEQQTEELYTSLSRARERINYGQNADEAVEAKEKSREKAFKAEEEESKKGELYTDIRNDLYASDTDVETKVFINDTELTPLEDMEGIIRYNGDGNTIQTIGRMPKSIRNAVANYRAGKPTQKDMQVINDAQRYIYERNGNIVASNGGHLASGVLGGGIATSGNNDNNGDGIVTFDEYAENFAKGFLGGALGSKATAKTIQKTMPKTYATLVEKYNATTGGNGMFVGARPDTNGNYPQGSFSDIATKKTMREIDDSKAVFNQKPLFDAMQGEYGKFAYLDEVLTHPELFNKYPELKDMKVMYDDNLGFSNGSFDGNMIKVSDKNSLNDTKSTLIHEVQHAIQRKEDMPRGGSVQYFDNLKASDNYDKNSLAEKIDKFERELEVEADIILKKNDTTIINEANKWSKQNDYDDIFVDQHDKIASYLMDTNRVFKEMYKRHSDLVAYTRESSFSKYQRLWGEQQARATQHRLNMTPEQRAKEDWTKTLERVEGKYNEPIIKYDDGIAMSVSKDATFEEKLADIRQFFKDKIKDKSKLKADEKDLYEFVMSNKNWVQFINDAERTILKRGDSEKGFKHIVMRHYGDGADSELSAWDVLRIGKTIKDGSNLTDAEFDYYARNLGNSRVAKRRIAKTPNGEYMYIVGLGREQNGDNLVITYYKANISDVRATAVNPQLEYTHKSTNGNGDRLVSDKETIAPNSLNENKLNASPTASTLAGLGASASIASADDGSGENSELLKYLALGVGGYYGTKYAGKALRGAGAKALDKLRASKANDTIEEILDKLNADTFIGYKIYRKESYMNLRENMIKAKNAQLQDIASLHETLKTFPEDSRQAMHKYLNGENVELTPALKEFADGYRNKIDTLGKELVDLGVLDQAQYEKFKGRYLHRSYEKDLTQKFSSLFSRGKTIRGVHTRGREWTGSKAEYERLLKAGEIGDFFNGKIEANQMKNGQYKFRQDWSDEQRARWGEITDVAYTLPETLMRMAEMAEHAKMLKGIAESTPYVLDEEVEGYTRLSGKRYGALNGKYVPNDIKSDIDEFGKSLFGEQGGDFTAEFKEAWRAFGSYWKKTHTVYNPTAHTNNLLSNITMQFMAGENPLRAVKNAMDGALASQKVGQFRQLKAKETLGLSADEVQKLRALEQDDDLQLYLQAERAGLFGRSHLNDILGQYVNPTKKAKKHIGNKIDDVASTLYQGEDNIMRFSLLKSIMKRGGTFDEAMKEVNRTIPDYTKPMSVFARTMRNSMIMPFISWTYYATPIVLRQMKDRPERIVALYGALYMINQAMGIDPFDDEDIPQKNFSMKRIPIFKDGKEVTTIKVDRWIPHSDILNTSDFLANTFSGGMWKAIPEVLTNQNYYFGGKISYRDGGEKAYDIGKYAVQQLTPDVLDQIYNTGESIIRDKKQRTKHPVIQPRTPTQELIRLATGVNIMTYDKNAQRKKAINEKLKELKKSREDRLRVR